MVELWSELFQNKESILLKGAGRETLILRPFKTHATDKHPRDYERLRGRGRAEGYLERGSHGGAWLESGH